jgi:prephenate dehydratase
MGLKKTHVAIQGISASFHEVAAQTYFGENIQTVECLSFQSMCEALKNDRAEFAVMAIENSIAGSILPNYALLQQFQFSIIGELYLPIHLHLLALPGVALQDIHQIESHPMAIRQCAEFLHLLDKVEVRESDDTALSARRISELKLATTAAIANEQAAKKFGLNILARGIETNKKNFTRFLVLTQSKAAQDLANKATLCFEVANQVGSLADVLTVLKDHQINLSKIQSVPILGRPSEYTIHIDVEWNKKSNYVEAMKETKRQVKNLNILGEYKKANIKF